MESTLVDNATDTANFAQFALSQQNNLFWYIIIAVEMYSVQKELAEELGCQVAPPPEYASGSQPSLIRYGKYDKMLARVAPMLKNLKHELPDAGKLLQGQSQIS